MREMEDSLNELYTIGLAAGTAGKFALSAYLLHRRRQRYFELREERYEETGELSRREIIEDLEQYDIEVEPKVGRDHTDVNGLGDLDMSEPEYQKWTVKMHIWPDRTAEAMGTIKRAMEMDEIDSTEIAEALEPSG